MDRGEPLNRRERVWRLIDTLHDALRRTLPRRGRWTGEVYVDRDPGLDQTVDGVVHDDGSMTLSGGAYDTLELAHDAMDRARFAPDPLPTRDATRRLRNAVRVLVRNYVELGREPAPLDVASRALDTGLRANTTAAHLPKVMEDAGLHAAYPDILELPDEDQHPVLQAAAETLCEQVGEAAGIEPDDLRDQLQATRPAERWDVLSDVLMKERLGARLDRGWGFASRVLPEEAASLKALLVRDLKDGFEAVAASTEDSRSNGQDLTAVAVRRATQRLEAFANSGPKPVEPPPHGPEPAYDQVSAIVDSVQRDLAIGRTDDNLAWVLTPEHQVNRWNGLVEATNEGVRDLGEARPDGILAVDARRVLAPLAEAHTAPRPLDPKLRADVHQAVAVVTREAARLCSPSDPESQHDPAAQAMEDALVRQYATWQTDRLMTDFGYGEPEAENNPMAPEDRAVAVLTQSIGQIAGMRQQEVVAQLLTTRRSDRFAKAVALGLGNDAPRHDMTAQREVDVILVPKVQAAFAQLARPEGMLGRLTGNRGERGEIVGKQAAAQIAEAKRYYASLPKGGGGANLQDRSQAAAMTGQPAPGSKAAATATSSRPASNKDDRGPVNGIGPR
jgi:hypothetical protein